VKFIGASGVEGGEWQHDEIHDLFHRGAEEKTADQRVFAQENEPAAGGVIGCRSGAGDEEVEKDSENISARASMNGFRSEQSRGDHERDVASEKDTGLSEI